MEQYAIPLMANGFSNPKISIADNNNFHLTYEMFPYHHPYVQSTCEADTSKACVIEHVSIAYNDYDKLNELDLGRTPVAAKEIKTKMKSSQVMHMSAGDAKADYATYDLTNKECARINQASLNWAL